MSCCTTLSLELELELELEPPLVSQELELGGPELELELSVGLELALLKVDTALSPMLGLATSVLTLFCAAVTSPIETPCPFNCSIDAFIKLLSVGN